MRHKWTIGEDLAVYGYFADGKTTKDDINNLAAFLGLDYKQVRGRMQNYILLGEKHKGRWNWSARERALFTVLSLIPEKF